MDELRRRKRSQTVLLIEISDLTKQLAEALDRRDQLAMQMLLGMRETPIHGLREIEDGIEDYILHLPEDSAIRGNELLRGAEAQNDQEGPLCEEVARFYRLLQNVVELDKRISVGMGGKQSVYTKL